MKKLSILFLGILLAITTTTFSSDLLKGLGFVAPQVEGRANVNPVKGEIIFDEDSGVNNFYGYDGTTWQSLTASTSTGNVVVLKDEKTSTTDGGTFTSGSWQTRDLNVKTGASFATLSSNEFTLDAGDYLIEAVVPAYRVDKHQARLYDVTNTTAVTGGEGSSSVANNSYGLITYSHISVIVSPASSTDYRIEHRAESTRATDGYGFASGFGTEVYTQVKITKLP